MRQLFSVFLFSFASLFFSQCEIGKISFALGDVLMFFTNGKVEGKDKNERKGDKDEDVINFNLKAKGNIIITTPKHKKNLSNMSDKSLYSGISTTVSQALQNNDGHNVVKKGVFDFAKNSSSPKRDLINSFNNTQAEEEDSCDNGEELLKKTDTYFVEKKRVGSDKGEQLKRVIRTDYRNLIKKKINEQNDQKRTFSLIRKGKNSSIFVPWHASIVNNEISQEVGDKKDVHKNINIYRRKIEGLFS